MPTEKERMLRGELYDPNVPELIAERERARELTAEHDRTPPGDRERRRELLEELFGSLGGKAVVEAPFRCDYGTNISAGDGFYANFGCVVLDTAAVEFGPNCLLGPGVHVYTPTHPLDAETRASGLERGEPVTVGENVWVGGQAVLNPGVSVGDDAVVASGAVVIEDVPAGTLVGGNPAEVLRELE
jgi:maltose O-acetyltransferase